MGGGYMRPQKSGNKAMAMAMAMELFIVSEVLSVLLSSSQSLFSLLLWNQAMRQSWVPSPLALLPLLDVPLPSISFSVSLSKNSSPFFIPISGDGASLPFSLSRNMDPSSLPPSTLVILTSCLPSSWVPLSFSNAPAPSDSRPRSLTVANSGIMS